MKKEIVEELTTDFESYKNESVPDQVEFWLARDLQQLLGYSKWDNFKNVISKAKTACETSGEKVDNHFVDAEKVVMIGSGVEKTISDIMLTRYACYLVAQNGDSKKEEIAFAQTYFAVKTRKAELIEKAMLEHERVQARRKLSETEKELSKVIFEHTGNDRDFGLIRSKGDKALFNYSTKDLKVRWGINEKRPLADFLPTILLKAKDFATEITIYNATNNQMNSEKKISNEHITNNKAVRDTLIQRGITPEEITPQEDIKKIERRLNTDYKKIIKGIKTFKTDNDE